jgi:hypothetical protein
MMQESEEVQEASWSKSREKKDIKQNEGLPSPFHFYRLQGWLSC